MGRGCTGQRERKNMCEAMERVRIAWQVGGSTGSGWSTPMFVWGTMTDVAG